MRRMLATALVAGVLAAALAALLAGGAILAEAKPNGYMGPGRPVATARQHAVRKEQSDSTFTRTVTAPVPMSSAQGPALPAKPASTVTFNAVP